MQKENLKKLKLPDEPGVYQFIGARGKILYIGKATSLRDRVRSYFADDLLHTRGKHIVDMVTLAKTVRFTATESVLEAVILEAGLIKKHQPVYNTKEKDNKSWNYVVITKETYPRVLTIRERTMLLEDKARREYKYVFGPFPQGTNLKEALVIVRKIFPFRDSCVPLSGKPCFNFQIGLCPGVCVGAITPRDYSERIREIALFFGGKKAALIKLLERTMHAHAAVLEFEAAGECKRAIFSLKHIKDASLISEEVREHSQRSASVRRKPFRIEAYDVAHISGKYTVGVMVVVEDGRPKNSDYRKFKIKIDPNRSNDVLHLEEVLRRRFAHSEWPQADLIVVDGGVAQKRVATSVAKEFKFPGTILSVVKNERHKPKAILGNKELALSYERGILIANAESHCFAVAYHRQLREKLR
jgi:excinuclease ABC subunit C